MYAYGIIAEICTLIFLTPNINKIKTIMEWKCASILSLQKQDIAYPNNCRGISNFYKDHN